MSRNVRLVPGVLTNIKVMKTKEQIEIERQETAQWVSKEFGIPAEDVLWYNSGCCYSRVIVATRKSAEKISAKVRAEHRTANGGMLDGMPLGGISEYKNEHGNPVCDVTC